MWSNMTKQKALSILHGTTTPAPLYAGDDLDTFSESQDGPWFDWPRPPSEFEGELSSKLPIFVELADGPYLLREVKKSYRGGWRGRLLPVSWNDYAFWSLRIKPEHSQNDYARRSIG